MVEWQFTSPAAEACRRVGTRRDMTREQWLAHYAAVRAARGTWCTGTIGTIYGISFVVHT